MNEINNMKEGQKIKVSNCCYYLATCDVRESKRNGFSAWREEFPLVGIKIHDGVMYAVTRLFFIHKGEEYKRDIVVYNMYDSSSEILGDKVSSIYKDVVDEVRNTKRNTSTLIERNIKISKTNRVLES